MSATARNAKAAGLYEEDLALVHEEGFAALAEAAGREVLAAKPPRGRAVDLGCGGGTLLSILVDAGFDGWGIDLSPAMVDLARRTVHARLQVGSVYGTPLPECSVATAVGQVLNYSGPADPGKDGHGVLFRRIHDALAPGGVFLFDVLTTKRPDGTATTLRQGRTWRVEATSITRDGALERTIEVWRSENGQQRRSREVHRQRLLDADALEAMLSDVGFTVERLGAYDDHAFEEGWDGFLARKG